MGNTLAISQNCREYKQSDEPDTFQI